MNPGWFTCAKPCPQKLTLSFYLPCERITHSNWQRRRAEPVRGRLATVRGRVQLKFPSHSPPAGSHHAQCFPVRGFFSGAISQGQSCVINRNRACRHRSLVQSAIVATGPPPEEPTVRTALSVVTPSWLQWPSCRVSIGNEASGGRSPAEPSPPWPLSPKGAT